MKRVPISPVDALFSNGSYPVEMLFYYRDGFSTRKLRRALRQLSSIFWPVFGEYRDGSIVFERYREENCFAEETVGREIDRSELEGAGAKVISRYGLPELERLFFLKVIRFKNGLVLVPKMNHVAGDGYSYFFFLSALAALARPTLVPFKSSFVKSMFKPHHRRTALKDFAFEAFDVPPLVQSEDLTVEFDEIPRREVQSLIREATSSAGVHLSSNDILSAMVLKKLAGLRRESPGDGFDLTMPIDVRRQVKEYGQRFFGNGIMLHTVELRRAGIDASSLKEIAGQIRAAMPSLTTENYVGYLAGLERMIKEKSWERFRPFEPGAGCLVTNLSKLPAEKLDFGTGGPQAIVPLTIEKNSAAILARGENYVLRFAY
ncbi:MAG: acyltransferase [Candidatus Aminicenantes bacterium]|nr:acyltransferase [Candidatus Aminicenantes bacterium]